MNNIERAALAAQMQQEASWLFWAIIGGTLLIGALWTLVRRQMKLNNKRRSDAALRAEVNRYNNLTPLPDSDWRRFCRANNVTVRRG